MEPLHPKIREALKSTYPGLTDEEIDESEELLGRRMHIDPDKEPEKLAELDRRRTELIQRAMPHYSEIVRQVQNEMSFQRTKAKPNFSVKIKRPTQKE